MDKDKAAFPIVGIGASAGGLEALQQFFSKVSADSGMAFVVVQHLDPHHASMLTDILQRITSLPVAEAGDDDLIEPDHIYIIPPNRQMTMSRRKLRISSLTDSQGPRLTIDTFLQSLAEDQRESAAGIILSGTGTDGTKGLGCILNAGGMTLAQEPTTAKYAGMPSSAIDAGYATHVLPVDEMPEALRSRGLQLPSHKNVRNSEKLQTVNDILTQMFTAIGQDFSQYKKSTIERRIERRMSQLAIKDIDVYAEFIKKNRNELITLSKEIPINVTSFFRDKGAFELLQQQIVPELCKNKPEEAILRVWVAGCASGEEVYSIAILLKEWMEDHHELKVQIYGTDLDEETIGTARAGIYPKTIDQEVTAERLNRFFTKVERGYEIKKTIREMVVFAVQNVLKDPPFAKLDLLSCRNLLIYLEPEMQNRLISTFYYALKPQGILFLSPSESIGNHPELFVSIDRNWKFYRSTSTSLTHANAAMTRVFPWPGIRREKADKENKSKEINFAEFTHRVLIQNFVPAAVITDLDGNIQFSHGDTGKFLRLAPGQPSLNIIEMARFGLELELRAAILAANDGNPRFHREVKVKTNGGYTMVNLDLRLLSSDEDNKNFLLVSFQENDNPAIEKPPRKRAKAVESKRVEELEQDLAYLNQNYQVTLEELQTSNEELKSTNEELQSTNEELQSTNEELETSKEELQSVNEEVITVNSELQAKIEQLITMQNDMKNLFDNTQVGTIFLDNEMKIRRFTREATTLYRLVASDVGRPLSDIKANLNEELLISAQSVLETLIPFEQEVQTQNKNCYLVRIQPYRTLENAIDGVVLTFTDITERNKVENDVRLAQELAESVVDTMEHPLLILDGELNVISSNRAFYQFFQVAAAYTIGKKIYNLADNDQWNIPGLRKLLEVVLSENRSFDDFVLENVFPAIGYQKLLISARRIIGKSSCRFLILLKIKLSNDLGTIKETA